VSNIFSLIAKPGQSGHNSKFSKEIYLTGIYPMYSLKSRIYRESYPARPVEPGTLCLPCSSGRWYMGVFNWGSICV